MSLVACVLATAGGCSVVEDIVGPDTSAPNMTATYDGPPMVLDSSGRTHVANVRLASPGWTLERDGTERGPEGQRVFVTVRTPNPEFLYPQQIVEQALTTEVRSTEPVQVYARVVEYGVKSSSKAYGLAAAAPGER